MPFTTGHTSRRDLVISFSARQKACGSDAAEGPQ
jgi:hypothetical protein